MFKEERISIIVRSTVKGNTQALCHQIFLSCLIGGASLCSRVLVVSGCEPPKCILRCFWQHPQLKCKCVNHGNVSFNSWLHCMPPNVCHVQSQLWPTLDMPPWEASWCCFKNLGIIPCVILCVVLWEMPWCQAAITKGKSYSWYASAGSEKIQFNLHVT